MRGTLWGPYLLLALGASGCIAHNSNTTDKQVFGTRLSTGSPRFIAAMKVVQAKCLSCHNGTFSNAQSFIPFLSSETAWVDAKLVVAGYPSSSKLNQSLRNNGGPNAHSDTYAYANSDATANTRSNTDPNTHASADPDTHSDAGAFFRNYGDGYRADDDQCFYHG